MESELSTAPLSSYVADPAEASQLAGQTILVTGGASGLGAALCHVLSGCGANVIVGDLNLDKAQTVASLLESSGGKAHAVGFNVGDPAAAERAVEDAVSRYGRLDVLINNAGTEYPTPLDDAGPHANARWADLLDNNVTSMLRLTRALLPLLADGASVINQSSIWGRIGVAGFSAYSASKHAVVGLTRSLALELGPRGIRVNAVCPGWVRTAAAMRSLAAMARERGCSEAEVERDILSRQAVPRMLEPADLAGVFLFLASPASRALTGQCLSASHGEVMA